MSEFHAEPYIYLPTVTHRSALVAWGAFYFRVASSGSWKLVLSAFGPGLFHRVRYGSEIEFVRIDTSKESSRWQPGCTP